MAHSEYGKYGEELFELLGHDPEPLINCRDARGLHPAEILALIIHTQTCGALMQVREDPDELEAPGDKLFRGKGQEAAPRGEIVLPFVAGEFVPESMRTLFTMIEAANFPNLPRNAAEAKANTLLKLTLVLHPQVDFNGRVYKLFFRYLSSLGKGRVDQPETQPKIPQDLHRIRKKLFTTMVPVFANHPKLIEPAVRFFFRKLFSYSRNPRQEAEEMAASADVGASWPVAEWTEDRWVYSGPTGISETDVRYFLERMSISHGIRGIDPHELYGQLKVMEALDSQQRYFSDLVRAAM